jgi:AAA domain-containing protein
MSRCRPVSNEREGPERRGERLQLNHWQSGLCLLERLSGKDVLVLAPSASAVQVLKNDGFAKSDTFQKFVADSTFQDLGRGQILWVDEPGFLSVKQMNWLVQFVARNGCSLVPSGDPRQHHGV